MLSTFRTLMTGANARAEERVRDVYALELIDEHPNDSEITKVFPKFMQQLELLVL